MKIRASTCLIVWHFSRALVSSLCFKMATYNSRVEELTNYFKSHNKIKEQQSHSAKVHSVGWSCDGRLLASGSFDKCVCIFSLGTDRLVRNITFIIINTLDYIKKLKNMFTYTEKNER